MSNSNPSRASKEKKAAALGSVLTSAFLTVSKLIVGLLTGSLAVLAQSADNALDLITTLMTYLAVRVAERPADPEHPYGHGKVESLSALTETALLIVTCVGIGYQAVRRLLAGVEVVQRAEIAIGMMILSIAIDLVRTTILRRTAHKHHSQALAADALNFTGDMLSSALVIAGLIFARVGVPWADPVAAMLVASVVLVGALRLARQAVDVLVDREPQGLADRVCEVVASVAGVLACRRVRARRVGAKTFTEVTIGVDRAVGLQEAHEIASAVEAALQTRFAPIDAVVHMEPLVRPDELPHEQVVLLARQHSLPVHQVFVREGLQGLVVDLHCEIVGHLSLQEAHEHVSALEEDIRAALPGVTEIVTHIEPCWGGVGSDEDAGRMRREVETAVQEAARELDHVSGCHQVAVRLAEGHCVVSLHCEMRGDMSLEEAHRVASELESDVRQRLPHIERVVVHTEPRWAADPDRALRISGTRS